MLVSFARHRNRQRREVWGFSFLGSTEAFPSGLYQVGLRLHASKRACTRGMGPRGGAGSRWAIGLDASHGDRRSHPSQTKARTVVPGNALLTGLARRRHPEGSMCAMAAGGGGSNAEFVR